MVFVNHDGTVGGRKSFGRLVSDFFMGIYSFFALFFSSIMNPPAVQSSVRAFFFWLFSIVVLLFESVVQVFSSWCLSLFSSQHII